MKLIVAIVRPFTIEKIVLAFEDIEDFPGVTVSEAEGFGQRIKTADDAIDPFRPNKRLEIVCADEMVESVVAAIKDHAHTGRRGDGLVIVLKIEDSTLI